MRANVGGQGAFKFGSVQKLLGTFHPLVSSNNNLEKKYVYKIVQWRVQVFQELCEA